MTTLMLTLGASSATVHLLQTKLNLDENRPRGLPPLPVTGTIDQDTIDYAYAFQRQNWLEERDRIDNACWNCLHHGERYNMLHNVPYIAQPDRYSCFAASLAMLLHPVAGDLSADSVLSSAYGRRHRRGVDVSYEDHPIGGLSPLDDDEAADDLQSAYPDLVVGHGELSRIELISILGHSPLMIFATGHGSTSHAMCIVGMRGNDSGDDVLTLRLYDPWSSHRSYWVPGQPHGMRSSTLQHLRYHYPLHFYVWAHRRRF